MQNRRILVASLLTLLGACSVAADKTREASEPVDGRFDSFFSPTDKGQIELGGEVEAELSDAEQFHAFHFELSGRAQVRLESVGIDDSSLDTVFYLYRQGDHGWGRYVARDDDGGSDYFSLIEETLEEGVYRLLVKGYDTYGDLGAYRLETACAGDGCAPRPTPALSADCLFGETYGDFRESPNFVDVESLTLRVDTVPNALVEAQILETFTFYSGSIDDFAEVFDQVDDGQINYTTVRDVFDGAQYTSIEYGAGDNGFGAILHGGTADVAAVIHDSDLDGCSVFEPADRWSIEAARTEPEAAIAEAFPGRVFSMRLNNRFGEGRGLPISSYDDLVDEAFAIVDGEDPCYGFPTGSETDVQDGWDPWYVDRWMGAAHVRNGWEDAPTDTQRAALNGYFEARGTENIIGLQGDMRTEACAGEGDGYFFLFHDRATADVLILLMYRYTE